MKKCAVVLGPHTDEHEAINSNRCEHAVRTLAAHSYDLCKTAPVSFDELARCKESVHNELHAENHHLYAVHSPHFAAGALRC